MRLARVIERAEDTVLRKAELDFAVAAEPFPGAAVGHFGSALATRLAELPQHVPYNKARPFRQEQRGALHEMLAFYNDHGLHPALEVWAGDSDAGLHRDLLDAGLVPGRPTAILHARPSPVQASGSVTVHEIDDDERYMEILYQGYGVDSEAIEFRTMLSIEHHTRGIRRYIAFVEGHPAAAGALFTHEGTSYLAGAATLPAYRRHGCQGALITRRLSDAAEDSDLAVVTVAFASPSHDNLARLGFQTTHTRTVWQ